MAKEFVVTVRTGPGVERLRAETLEGALELAEEQARRLRASERRAPVELRVKSYAPGDQVAGRVEVRGPKVAGGYDVRGNGDVLAFTGRFRRRLVEERTEETPYAALRRALTEG